MNSVEISNSIGHAEVYKPSWKTWLVVIGATLLCLGIYSLYPITVLVAVVMFVLFVFALFLVPNLKTWLLLLPVLFTFGSSIFELGPLYISVTTIVVVASFILYLVNKVVGFKQFPEFPLPVYLILFAYLAQLASMFMSLHLHDNTVGNTIREAHKVFIAAALIPLIYDWYGKGDWLMKMLKMVVLMLLVMSVYGIYQYNFENLETVGEMASGFDLAGRIYSTFHGGPNPYSGVLELLIPTSLAAFFFFKTRLWKTIALTATLLGIQNIMYTFSRGGFLTVTASCFVYLIYRYRGKVWVPVLALSIFAGGVITNAEEFERQLTVFSNTSALMLDSSLLHRYVSYMGYLTQIANSPVSGVGWGSREFFHGGTSFYSFWEVRHEYSVDKIESFGGVNSLVLEMPLKGGVFSVLSLLLLISAVLVTFSRLLKHGREKALGMGMICGLGAFGIHQIVDNLIPWPQTGAFFWLVFALLISLAYPCCDKQVDSV